MRNLLKDLLLSFKPSYLWDKITPLKFHCSWDQCLTIRESHPCYSFVGFISLALVPVSCFIYHEFPVLGQNDSPPTFTHFTSEVLCYGVHLNPVPPQGRRWPWNHLYFLTFLSTANNFRGNEKVSFELNSLWALDFQGLSSLLMF